MTLLESAIELAAKGFRVFPIKEGEKTPPIFTEPEEKATTDEVLIKFWWGSNPRFNIGISTRDLVVVDVDMGVGKSGGESLLALELEGKDLPSTYTQKTPGGGAHYVYKAPYPLKQGTSVFGKHIDTRAKGGYILGAGSVVGGKTYVGNDILPQAAPDWLVQACGPANKKKKLSIDEDRAAVRARERLKSLPVVEGGNRNHAAYIAASLVKDEGVGQTLCLYLMEEHFLCEPPLDYDELSTVVASAYKYGNNPVGVNAPETVFAAPDVRLDASTSLHPFAKLNREFAFVVAGGGSHILWETEDAEGVPCLEHLSPQTFHQLKAAERMQLGDKSVSVTHEWMKHPSRRTYEGVCFLPGQDVPSRFYNMWRGFSVEPLPIGVEPDTYSKKALNMFLEHALKNVCQGEQKLFKWLMGYFAHIFQHPGEKPLVALVFRGGKGTGKNALVERIGHLLGGHFKVAADKRYLTGNFNSHMERSVLFVLDEAFWSGDKQAEGILKSLITGRRQMIEHKGKESYDVKNCMRVVIIGNEEWLVPASNDERRWAVFDVGDGRKKDMAFFLEMRKLMEAGGYRYLLRYLLDYDLTGINVNEAPITKALLEQKLESLSPLHQWWFDCLRDEMFVESDIPEWQECVESERLRDAFRRYVQARQIKSRIVTREGFGKCIRDFIPSVKRVRLTTDGRRTWSYEMPSVQECRKSFEAFLKQSISWD